MFPVEEAVDGSRLLCEDLDMPDLGLPMDMNADGEIDHDDRADDYVLLPVRVRVRWRAAGGPNQLELRTILAGY